jgi:hypothetical protein
VRTYVPQRQVLHSRTCTRKAVRQDAGDGGRRVTSLGGGEQRFLALLSKSCFSLPALGSGLFSSRE